MKMVFISVLLMSVTGAMLVLCLSLLHPITKKCFNAVWHYRVYLLATLFFFVPIGTVGAGLLMSISNNAVSELPSVPTILNTMMTAPGNNILTVQNPPQMTLLSVDATEIPESISDSASSFSMNTVLIYLPFVWLTGVFIFAVWQGVLLVRFKRSMTRTSLKIEDDTTLSVFMRQIKALKIRSKPRLMSNDMIKTPMLIGLFKTYLIMPEVEMSERELSVILKHELVHFKRRDLWVKSLALLANAVHWFNPTAYQLTKQIDVFCELSCDELVVADMDEEERQFYGETILNVLCRVVNGNSGVYATLAESKKGIKQRLAHMMNVKKTPRVIFFASLVIALALFLTGCAIASVINARGETLGNDLLIDESVNFLAEEGGRQYYWVVEDNNCVLYSTENDKSAAKQLAVFAPMLNGDNEPTINTIIDFGIIGEWIIVSVGHYEGSGQYFYGDFARLKKDGSNLEHFWLTDDDTFVIVEDWIYYNFWTVKGSDNEGVYRIHPDGTNNEYMGDIFHSIFLYAEDGYVYGEKDIGKTIDNWNPITDLIRCNPDGSRLATLFSGDSLPKFTNSDYMRYSDIEVNKDYVAFTVSVHGYAEGDSWRGHYNYIADYRVDKDGSNLTLLHEEYPVSHATIEPWVDAYMNVLQNNAAFYSTDTGASIRIEQLTLALTGEEDRIVSPIYFNVIDLDKNGTPEVVIWLKWGEDEYFAHEILSYRNGTVFGYTPTWRAFYELKNDGTFWYSSGASDNGFGTITFEDDTFTTHPITYCESDGGGTFYVNNEQVNEAEFQAAARVQDEKPGVSWYEFTEENINVLLSAANLINAAASIRTETITLDENGKNDDMVQLLGGAPDGWYYEGVEVTVVLGNGSKYSKLYNEEARNSPALYHADFTGDGIDEMVLVLPNITSNFGATNVHVLSAANGDIVEILTVLCTPIQEDIDKYAQTWLGIQDFLCTGASVVSLNGKPALRIEQLSRRDSAHTIIWWDGGQWVTEPQQIEKYFLYSNSRTYDMAPQPLPTLDESQVLRTLVTEKTEGFTQAVYRSNDDEDSEWNFHSYIEIGGSKYDLGHIGYGNDDYFKDGLKASEFGKFMDIDGVTVYTQHKWHGATYDSTAFYKIINGMPYFLYEIANATEFYQDGNLLTVLSSSRSQPLTIELFCMDIANSIILSEDLHELMGCWAVGYNFEQKLVYAYEESNKNDPAAVYKLDGLELVKQ